MADSPFTVGIIQDGATADPRATVEATIPRIREAASRGAQIICLKELFNAPYFCKSQQCERFDIAEPIPGPTVERMQKLAGRVGFRMGPGLRDRVIYRELFPKGLTLLDLQQMGEVGIGHITARQELREMIAGLGIPGAGEVEKAA